MPRLYVLDAMGLAYRAYYAFIGRPLARTFATAEHAGTARVSGLSTVFHQNSLMVVGEGATIEILDDQGRELQHVAAPRGAYIRVADGDRVAAGQALLAENTSAIYGFANTALKIRREEKPEYWALAWDGPGPTHRHHAYAAYKATRKPMPEDLLHQIPAIEEMAAALGLPVLEIQGMEADDVMATLAARGASEGLDVVLVTSDKDMLQLVNDRIRLYQPVGPTQRRPDAPRVRPGEEYTWVDRDAVIEKWGVTPEQIRDVLALMGDSIDNIPGVPGVGQKTAVELISRFGSMDALYERLAEVGKKALTEKLTTHREQAFLSRELVTVATELDLPVGWEDLTCGPLKRDALRELARRYELVRLERIADEAVSDAEVGFTPVGRKAKARGSAATGAGATTEHEERDLFAPRLETSTGTDFEPRPFESSAGASATDTPPARAAQGSLELWSADAPRVEDYEARLEAVRARAAPGLGLFPVIDSGEPRTARVVGLALSARDGTTAYVPLGHETGVRFSAEQVRERLGAVLADPGVPKIGEDLKVASHALRTLGIELEGLELDLHVGSFLLDPERDHSLAALARDALAVALPPLDPAGGRRVPLASLPPGRVAAWAERAAGTLHPLADALRAQLEARDQWTLYRTLEHPLIPVLLDMECCGIAVDRDVLVEMSRQSGQEIARLEEELYALAGERINLNSGPQLGRVLFEKLGLKTGRRTKTGYSTDQAVLEELGTTHPFPARLLEYRALSKLKSTYLDALPAVIDPRDLRVHTTYHQAGAATGRLSSSNPNLQNIPMRSPQGRAIRRAFVAPEGRVLVSADYSQIELRVMAHLSGDPQLIEAFRSGEDIHESTARRIFGLASGPLDPGLRARAKIVNFGIMYGMGARSLSQQMGIALAEAQDFIAGYFRVFARVREFIDSGLDEARRRGYVQTLFGRRRYLDLANPNGGLRSLAERAAINAPIQGSAADLMKIAMTRVHAALMQSVPSARLLLQVHDELLLECSIADADEVAARVRSEMEGAAALAVPLEVSVGRGPTWLDAH
jgi:DNA polymerase-1